MQSFSVVGRVSILACIALAAACGGVDDSPVFYDDPPEPPGPVVAPPPWSAAPARCIADHWCWMDPLPFGGAITAVYAQRSTNAWFVGEGGLVGHFDGTQWSFVDCGTASNLINVSSTSPTDAWFVGDEGVFHWDGAACANVLHSDVGQAYQGARVGPLPMFGVWASGPADAFASDGGTLFHFDGASWSRSPIALVGLPVFSGSSHRNVWLFGAPTPLHWIGTEWQPVRAAHGVGREYLQSGTASRTDSIYALSPNTEVHEPNTPVGSAGYKPGDVIPETEPQVVEHFDGTAWRVVAPFAPKFYARQIASGAPGDVWVGGIDVVHLEAGSWVSQDIGFVGSLSASAANDVWASTPDTIKHFDGASWSSFTSRTVVGAQGHVDSPSRSLSGSGPDDVWIVRDHDGGLAHYDGKAFAISPSDARIVWSASPKDAWALGASGLSHWDGTSWKVDMNAYFSAIGGSSATDVWALGLGKDPNHSTVTHFDGSSWTSTTADVALGPPLWVNGPNDVWAASSNFPSTTVAHWDGQAWTTATIAGPYGHQESGSIYGLWSSGPNDVWMAADFGLAHFDGHAWSEVAFDGTTRRSADGVTGSGPNDVTVVTPRQGSGSPNATIFHWDGTTWSSSAVPDVNEIWSVARGETWALTRGGVLRRRQN